MAKKKQKPIPEKPDMTPVYAAAAVIIIAALAIYLYSGYSGVPVNETGTPANEKLPTSGKFVKLNKPGTYEEGKVKIMEFLKFDCSHCYDLHRSLPSLMKKYDGNITITYIPIVWPKQSTKSIEAYIIAEQMGKGEEMRDALFQAEFVKRLDIMESSAAIESTASGIGLGDDFRMKLENGDGKKAALENLEKMSEYNVQGTPTLIINGNINVEPTITNLDTVVGSLLNSS